MDTICPRVEYHTETRCMHCGEFFEFNVVPLKDGVVDAKCDLCDGVTTVRVEIDYIMKPRVMGRV